VARHQDACHLPREHLGAVTVAVDADRRAGADRLARERAVQVEMRRRAVDFDDRTAFCGCREQTEIVEVVSAAVRQLTIGGMRDHRDERMTHRAQIALEELVGRMARASCRRPGRYRALGCDR
jgi:hypothetical protein